MATGSSAFGFHVACRHHPSAHSHCHQAGGFYSSLLRHFDLGDDDRVTLLLPGDFDGVTGVLGQRREILIDNRPDLPAVIGHQYELVAGLDAPQRALALIDLPAVIAAAAV